MNTLYRWTIEFKNNLILRTSKTGLRNDGLLLIMDLRDISRNYKILVFPQWKRILHFVFFRISSVYRAMINSIYLQSYLIIIGNNHLATSSHTDGNLKVVDHFRIY